MFDQILTATINLVFDSGFWALAGAFLGYSLARSSEKWTIAADTAIKSEITDGITPEIADDIADDITPEIEVEVIIYDQEVVSDLWVGCPISDTYDEIIVDLETDSVMPALTGITIVGLLPAGSDIVDAIETPEQQISDLILEINSMNKEELISKLKALGIKATKRWKLETLKAKLEECWS